MHPSDILMWIKSGQSLSEHYEKQRILKKRLIQLRTASHNQVIYVHPQRTIMSSQIYPYIVKKLYILLLDLPT